MSKELESFLQTWEFEAQNTIKVLKSLPEGKYDFRPDPQGRSLGELAWHLVEVEAYMTFGIEQNSFAVDARPPGIERPRQIAELAPGYERLHRDAVARVRKLQESDLARTVVFFDGKPLSISIILWGATLHHLIHHRGQLVLMTRLAGGTPPGIFGPNREDMAKMLEAARAKS
jgi:uncharacterized damage-inducible protein DinB